MAIEKRPPKISQNKFHRPGYRSIAFVAEPDFGVTLDRVMEEDYWGHVARELKAGYTIEVLPEGLTYYARLIVIDADPTRARVKLLDFVDLTGQQEMPEIKEIVREVPVGDRYKAERNGRWWRLLRRSDKEVMKTGFATMEDAMEWAEDNLKVHA